MSPLQYHQAQLDVLVTFIVMPLTDLPVVGQVIATAFGLANVFGVILFAYIDVFTLFYVKYHGNIDDAM